MERIQKYASKGRIILYILTFVVLVALVLFCSLTNQKHTSTIYNLLTLTLFSIASIMCIIMLILLIKIIKRNFNSDL